MEHSISETIFFGPMGVPLIERILYIHTYISLFKVDENHNSLLTNKHRLKLKKKEKKYNHVNYIYPTLAIKFTRAIVKTP